MADTCATCRFFFENYTREEWKRLPPPPRSQDEPGMCRIRSVLVFPPRHYNDWCGEHQPRDHTDAGEKEKDTE